MAEKILNFIKKPSLCIDKSNISGNSFLKLLLLFYMILIPASAFIFIMNIFEILPSNRIEDPDATLNSLGYIIFLAPLLEELVFRLPLRLSRITLSVSFAVFIIVVIKLFFFLKDVYTIYLLSIPLSGFIFGLFFKMSSIDKGILPLN